jgi:hypothetical protein
MEFSMEFHGIFRGILWENFMKKKSNVYEEFHGKFHGIPWNSMGSSETGQCRQHIIYM